MSEEIEEGEGGDLDPRLNKEEEAALSILKYGPFEEAAEKFFHVVHRNKAGEAPVPYVLNNVQQHYEEETRKALVLNVRMEFDAAVEGQESYIPDLVHRIRHNDQIWEWEVGLFLLHLKYRRTGASTYWGHKGFRRICTLQNYFALIMSHDAESAAILFDLPKVSYDEWPLGLRRIRPPIIRDNDSQFRLKTGSRYRIITAGARDSRERLRGDKVDFAHLSEYAYYKSYKDVAQLMKILQPHAWLIKESTANGKGNTFYKEWQKALSVDEATRAYNDRDHATLSAWNRHYRLFSGWLEDEGLAAAVLDWEKKDFALHLTPEERAIIKHFDKNPTKGYRKVKWRRLALAKSVEDDDVIEPEILFKREYPSTEEEAFSSSGSTLFTDAALERIRAYAQATHPTPRLTLLASSVDQPKPVTPRQANLFIFEPPQKGHYYAIGVDVGMGVEKDYTVAVVLDRCDGTRLREAAVFRSNRVAPNDVGHIIAMLGEWYFTAPICAEINAGGIATNNTLVHDCIYPRVYHRMPLDQIGVQTGNVFQYGFYTNNKSKQMLVGDLREQIQNQAIDLFFAYGIGELALVEHDAEKNTYAAPEGGKDDYFMALAMAVHQAVRTGGSVRALAAEAARATGQKPEKSPDAAVWEVIMAQMEANIRVNSATRGPGYRPPVAKK